MFVCCKYVTECITIAIVTIVIYFLLGITYHFSTDLQFRLVGWNYNLKILHRHYICNSWHNLSHPRCMYVCLYATENLRTVTMLFSCIPQRRLPSQRSYTSELLLINSGTYIKQLCVASYSQFRAMALLLDGSHKVKMYNVGVACNSMFNENRLHSKLKIGHTHVHRHHTDLTFVCLCRVLRKGELANSSGCLVVLRELL